MRSRCSNADLLNRKTKEVVAQNGTSMRISYWAKATLKWFRYVSQLTVSTNAHKERSKENSSVMLLHSYTMVSIQPNLIGPSNLIGKKVTEATCLVNG